VLYIKPCLPVLYLALYKTHVRNNVLSFCEIISRNTVEQDRPETQLTAQTWHFCDLLFNYRKKYNDNIVLSFLTVFKNSLIHHLSVSLCNLFRCAMSYLKQNTYCLQQQLNVIVSSIYVTGLAKMHPTSRMGPSVTWTVAIIQFNKYNISTEQNVATLLAHNMIHKL
jgi:hypothetical protein